MRLDGARHFRSDKPSDSLLFYAVLDRSLNEQQNEGDVFEVQYGIYHNEQTKAVYLGRRCAVVADPFVGNDKGTLACIAKNIEELKFEYYDANGWVSQWEDPGRLPTMVRVTMKFRYPENENIETEISQVISLKPIPE
jgi:hypothetical protein